MSDERFCEVLTRRVDETHTAGDLFQLYLAFSEVLVGRAPLAPWLGRAYLGTLLDGATLPGEEPQNPLYTLADIAITLLEFARLQAEYGDEPAQLERQVQELLVASGDARATVSKSIIALWYCAGLIDLTPPDQGGMGFLTRTAPKETYASALVWQAVGGNPMGIPGPYYGNWSYPSPATILPPARSR